jgi:hydroxyacylglutathione hydrolase
MPFRPGLVHSGAQSRDRDRLTAIRDEHGVREIWLSHAHEDHFLHMDLFDGVPLCVAEIEAGPLKDMDALIDAYDVEEKFKAEWRTFLRDVIRFQPRTPDRFLRGGDCLCFDDMTIEIIATPGHTPGHLSFYFREPDVLFMGDYDLSGFGPWYGDRHSDIRRTIESVRHLHSLKARIKLTSHETGVFENESDDIWEKYLAVIDRREKQLLELLHIPRTIKEITDACIVYGRPREPAAFFEFGEKALMGKHLLRLLQNNTIMEKDSRYVII